MMDPENMEVDGSSDDEYFLASELLESDRDFVDLENGRLKMYDVKEPLGYAVLLGCDRTPYEAPVECVRKDLELMKKTLRHCEWEVSSPCIEIGRSGITLTKNLYDDVFESLRDNPSLREFSCFLFYYTGHGVSDAIVLHDGSDITYEDIVTDISNLRALYGKPKIFIFDSCRTKLDAEHFEYDTLEDKSGGFHVDIKRRYKQKKEKHQGYPPPDTIICFSANDGSDACGTGKGSFYTLSFSNAVRNLRRWLSFSEIVTQTNAGTLHHSMAKGEFQQPVSDSTLNGLLYLSTRGPIGGPYEVFLTLSPHRSIVSLPQRKDKLLERKGRWPPKKPALLGQNAGPGGEEVVTDRGRSHKRGFLTRQDVEKHLNELGEETSVFICYAPDPESPYNDPKGREAEIARNERDVFLLVNDLEQHGFKVMTDLHVADNPPTDWLRWYSARIELCDHVILVCSPAFKVLFSSESLRQQPADPRAKLLFNYSRTIYNELGKEISNTSKFIPVILDPFCNPETSVPILFPRNTVYNLYETRCPREFHYENRHGAFERLVCRMAGINREKIDAPKERAIHAVPRPHEKDLDLPDDYYKRYVQSMAQPRQGYKVIPSKLSNPPPQPAASPWATHQWGQTSGMTGQTQYTYQQPPRGPFVGQQTSTYPQAPRGQQIPAGPTYPQGHYQYQQQPMVPPPGAIPPMQSSYPPAAPPQSQLDPSTLPSTIPNRSVILWLSQRLVRWKFFARHLGLEDYEIERIEAENAGDIKEQCYVMFRTWYQRKPAEYTYQTLGRVILDSEKNKKLYADFVKEVVKAAEEE